MADDFAIKVENVSKTFKLPHEKNSSIKSQVVNFWRRKKGYEVQEALKDVAFEVKKGEFFGIVGRNGSGKSTLLKLLAGIYTPTEGQVHVRGKLTPFIELGVGFNPELTGRENVFLNGALLGFNRKEMTAMYDDIVDFAELERFMDQKLKNYSSGMQVRLAFSIAIRAQTDILLVDEVLAVGDANFQRKCYEYFKDLKKTRRTVVFVSHDMGAVERFCDKAILIDQGELVHEGDSGDIAREYEKRNLEFEKDLVDNTQVAKDKIGLGAVDIHCRILNSKGQNTTIVPGDQDIIIESRLTARAPLKDALFSFTFENSEGKTVCQFSTDDLGIPVFHMQRNETKTLIAKVQNVLGEDTYIVDPEVSTIGRETIFGHVDNACNFKVRVAHSPHAWLWRPDYSIEIGKDA